MEAHQEDFKEIITKAVCASGKNKVVTTDYIALMDQPSNILGCWVINHLFHAEKIDASTVEIDGSYEINVWYAMEDNTRTEVVKETIHYCDEVTITEHDLQSLNHDIEINAKAVKDPFCLRCNIEAENQIAIDVEREFVVDVIGETKLRVKVEPVSVESNYKKVYPIK